MPAQNSLTLGGDRALYLGELPATGWHRHASPVLLQGLSGRFALHLSPGRLETCHSALIDTGIEHVFDPLGETVALVYLEPDAPEVRSLRALFGRHGGVILDPARPVQARSASQTRLQAFDLPALLALDLPVAAPLDARVQHSLRLMRLGSERPLGRAEVATAVQLSPSRFNHLFSAEIGVSFRDYRIWSQVRAAMSALAAGPRLTDAALSGAFVDSSHFSRMFRQTFGMTPSSVLKPLREVRRV
jgi:AraC-like DNA-binding protein